MQPLGPIGIWSHTLRFGDPGEVVEAAAELEQLGFAALWIPDVGGPVLESVERLLGATSRTTIATGILNVWMHDAAGVAAGQVQIDSDYPGRFLLGLGVSHAPIVDAERPGRYRRPLATMRLYLDALDAATPAGSDPARLLAALGPRMLELARERTLGAHPYLVPVEHTAGAREALGTDRLLAPALSVVLEADLQAARAVAREDLTRYFELPNYTNAWQRLGFSESDLAGGGSNRLVESLYALGPSDRIAERVCAHREAGADHVCLRVVRQDTERLPRAEWRALAEALIL